MSTALSLSMSFAKLYVWGPAFGLPSIDPESLAAIAYLHHALPQEEWNLIASMPASVPTQTLPALYDSSTQTWISGFTPITAHLAQYHPSSNPDVDLSNLQHADTTAYTTYLTLHVAPLLSLSLYVSSANWTSTTRPAYSALIPFPLTWVEPPAIRSAHAARAEHLGLSSLDTDMDATDESADEAAARRAGFLQVPASLRRFRDGRSVAAALGPEAKAKIRLDALAGEVFGVLQGIKGSKRWLLSEEGAQRPSSLDCLAFGYLALMFVPDVPRAFLKETMKARFSGLVDFVEDMRKGLPDVVDLPWVDGPKVPQLSAAPVADIALGAISHIPELGGVLSRWWSRHRTAGIHLGDDPHLRTAEERDDTTRDVLASIGGTAALAAFVASILYYRHLPAFGSSLYRWESDYSGRMFGAVGAALGLGRFGGAFGNTMGGPQDFESPPMHVSAEPGNDL